MTSPEEVDQNLDVEEFLDDRLDTIIGMISTEFGFIQIEAMAICMFSLANRINYKSNEDPTFILINTNHPSGKGRLRLAWYDRSQRAPCVTDYKANRLE